MPLKRFIGSKTYLKLRLQHEEGQILLGRRHQEEELRIHRYELA